MIFFTPIIIVYEIILPSKYDMTWSTLAEKEFSSKNYDS